MSEQQAPALADDYLKSIGHFLQKLLSVFQTCDDQSSSVSPSSAGLSPTNADYRDKLLAEFSINYISPIKRIVLANADNTEDTANALTSLSQQLQSSRFFPIACQYFAYFSLDMRKDISFIITTLLRKNAGNLVLYCQQHADIIESLISALVRTDTALSAGQILREAAKYPYLAYFIFLSSHFWHFFETYLHSPNFDVASESFALIKELLTSSQLREVQDGFFETNGEVFLQQYQVNC